jgi:hypothetical protein
VGSERDRAERGLSWVSGKGGEVPEGLLFAGVAVKGVTVVGGRVGRWRRCCCYFWGTGD